MLGTHLSTNPSNTPRQAALAALAVEARPVAGVVGYASRGVLLVCGPAARVRAAAEALAQLPHCTALLTDGRPSDGWQPPQAESRLYHGAIEAIAGQLGRFVVQVRAADWVGNPREADGGRYFDTVLDLGDTPALIAERLPPGYFAPRDDAAALQQAIAELPELVGEFEKPVYIRYAADLCARGASGLTGCTRCAEVCPAWAITPGADQVTIDTQLCQGLGPCTTVCPSGAIGYAYPERGELLAGLRRMLAAYRAAGGGRDPVVLFHGRDWAAGQPDGWQQTLAPNCLPVEMEEVGAVGSDSWFAALAFGAAQVTLMIDGGVTRTVRKALDSELATATAILAGLGQSPERLVAVTEATTPWPAAPAADWPPAGFSTDQDKRTTQLMAIDHLATVGGTAASAPAPLPAGAAFGDLAFRHEACTLCLACVSICPLKALHDGGDTPRLAFVEQNCVQCGLCVEACPEQVLTLAPRFLFDTAQRGRQRVLKEEEPLRCITCGKPFATPSVINLMTMRLKDHPMFSGERINRLKMCEDCRVRALFDDQEAQTRGAPVS